MIGNDWLSASQEHLMIALNVVRTALQEHAGESPEQNLSVAIEKLDDATALFNSDQPPLLLALAQAFDLSDFEQQVLLLCAGAELDARFTSLYAAAQGDSQKGYPTFSLALAALPNAHWSVLSPQAPLRRWRFIEVSAGAALTTSALRIDERILCYLTGLQTLDARLMDVIEPVTQSTELVGSHKHLAKQAAAMWMQAPDSAKPVISLHSSDEDTRSAVAFEIGQILSRQVQRLPSPALPASVEEIATLSMLWQRECKLSPGALLLDIHESDAMNNAERLAHRLALLENSLIIVASRHPYRLAGTKSFQLEVLKPAPNEQATLWRKGIVDKKEINDALINDLVSQFDFGASSIQSACSLAEAGFNNTNGTAPELKTKLWNACRQQNRAQLGSTIEVIDPVPEWDDLILPKTQKQTVREIIAQVRQRQQVYESWGFAANSRGLGISALFAGPSGTGKTLASEVIAKELQLDLYRIDLSQVVSKYVGETEKNLSNVFDAAEQGCAVLLFDEADALFGKRTTVQDSHDRHANIEVSYLLQKMESYRGLAILTSNMKDALDSAFMRRLRFVISFPFPDSELRADIWQRIVPEKLVNELDIAKLAQLNIAGGNIRNIALNAAFLAADQDSPLNMSHVEQATRTEYMKLEKSLTDAELRGWG